MKKATSVLLLTALFWHIVTYAQKESKSLLIYVGAASKPPTEEIVTQFQKETGIKVEAIFGGSGYIMSQMKLAGKGDIYFPGSSDYMEIAKREKLVFPETEKKVVYLVNAINVQKDNPKNIKTLKDLCKPGIKVAIANPEGVCVGSYAVEIIEKNLSKEEKEQFRKNLSNYTESCDKTASAIALKTVDAVIGWEVFQYWNPEMIETVSLKKEEIIRIGYIPIAIATYTKDKKTAQKFIDYVNGPKGKTIFKKYSYFAIPAEAEKYIGAKKPVGGEYVVPASWLNK
ncbi:MAG: molybdate ABC transporter substrate-binding protein [Bacteroidetes bacterium]|nr:molybdate ABC transporter substrate-binding protein [Bacteroidota bacterium]MBV6461388.1 putative binding protein [Flavobacteriales bacterium]WKZ75211.1 MAG: molybdate ABC transporter substrate-binding protein [Vicingaceae bacterium]MCL4817436.1 molybdate ABC transporter substrate-binding protein [Flavobacteriales bacterium]NOG96104.1 molybdate ABC transporter substrate-binding protein [Bacteroidota bacterium]